MKVTRIGYVALALMVAGLSATVAKAQNEKNASSAATSISLPAGTLVWKYQCKPGAQCPSRCATGATEVFQTSNYSTITVAQFSGGRVWTRVDTGQGNVDYVGNGPLICSFSGATLMSAAAEDKPGQLSLDR